MQMYLYPFHLLLAVFAPTYKNSVLHQKGGNGTETAEKQISKRSDNVILCSVTMASKCSNVKDNSCSSQLDNVIEEARPSMLFFSFVIPSCSEKQPTSQTEF